MVDDLYDSVLGHALGCDQGLGVDQDDALDLDAPLQVLVADVGQLVPIEGEEIAEVAVGAAG